MARSVKNEEFTEFCKCDCSVKQSDSRVRGAQCFASMQRCQEFPTLRNTLYTVCFKGAHKANLDYFLDNCYILWPPFFKTPIKTGTSIEENFLCCTQMSGGSKNALSDPKPISGPTFLLFCC